MSYSWCFSDARPSPGFRFLIVMRAIWKGAISFGLVSIPIALYPATKSEELKFRLLRASDLSPVNFKRVAEADGKEVQWDQIVKGYEYEKGRFVVFKEEDFRQRLAPIRCAQKSDRRFPRRFCGRKSKQRGKNGMLEAWFSRATPCCAGWKSTVTCSPRCWS